MRYLNKSRVVVLLNSAIIILLYTAVFSFTWEGFYNTAIDFGFFRLGNIGFAVIYAILLIVCLELFNGLHIGDLRISDLIYSQFLSVVFTDIVTYLIMCMIARKIITPFYLFVSLGVCVVFIVFWTNFICRQFAKITPARKTLMVYGSRSATHLVEKMSDRYDKFMISEAVSSDEDISVILQKVSRFSAVVVCDTPNEIRNDIIKYCFKNRIVTYIVPKISDIILRGADDMHTFDTPLLYCKTFGLKMEYRIFKRIIDIVFSALAIIILFIVFAVTAIMIKTYDKGPVLYKQQRLTINGKVFWLYKFRSMRIDAEEDGVARLSVKGDDRITSIGRIIRKIRIDELPQLFNILKGDMSLVGPRPERPEIAEEYEKQMPEFTYRLAVKAGLTGYAQVMGKYNTTPYDKLKMDMIYIQQYNIAMDLKLLIKTVKIMFIPESTEGIDVGMITADINAKTEEEKKDLIEV